MANVDLTKLYGKQLDTFDANQRTPEEVVIERLTHSKQLLKDPTYRIKNKKKGGEDNPTEPRKNYKQKGSKWQVWAAYGKSKLEISRNGNKVLNTITVNSIKEVEEVHDNLILAVEQGQFKKQLEELAALEKSKLQKARLQRAKVS